MHRRQKTEKPANAGFFCECVRAHHVVAQTSNCGAANAYSVVLGTLTGSDCWLQSRRVRCAMQGLQEARLTRALPRCSHVFPAVPKKISLRLRPLSSSTRVASPAHAMPDAGQDDRTVYTLTGNGSFQLAVHAGDIFLHHAPHRRAGTTDSAQVPLTGEKPRPAAVLHEPMAIGHCRPSGVRAVATGSASGIGYRMPIRRNPS